MTLLPNVLPQQVFVDLKPGRCLQQLFMQTKAAVAETEFCIVAASVTDYALDPCMSHRNCACSRAAMSYNAWV